MYGAVEVLLAFSCVVFVCLCVFVLAFGVGWLYLCRLFVVIVVTLCVL